MIVATMKALICDFSSYFFLMIPRPPISTLFPYTTLFRSETTTYTYDGNGFQTSVTDPLGETSSKVYKDRKSTRLNSSHANISYAVFCLKKKTRGQDRGVEASHLLTDAHRARQCGLLLLFE